MFDTIAGLPIHPLIVHAVVVVLPVVALAGIGAVTRRAWRSWIPGLTVAAAISVGLAWVAEESGKMLQSRVGDAGIHAEYGEWVKSAAFALFIALGLFWFAMRRRGQKLLQKLMSLAVIVAAVASVATVFLAGHSGAEKVWKVVIENTVPGDQ